MKGKGILAALIFATVAFSHFGCERRPAPEPEEEPAPVEKQKKEAPPAPARQLTKVGEISGLKNPESVLYDPDNDVLYASNVNGGPTEMDGNGFITKASLVGEIIELEWVNGLDAPKGMALKNGKLYVSDIGKLVEIDIHKGEVSEEYPHQGAKFLNDVAAGPQNGIYVSDMTGNAIYRLDESGFNVWLKSPELESPNGLYVDNGKLYVASWQGKTSTGESGPGHLKVIDIKSKKIESLGSGQPIGSLDGIQPDGEGNFYVTDYQAGKLLLVEPSGRASVLLNLNQGSADLEYIPHERLIVIPLMNDNKLAAFSVK